MTFLLSIPAILSLLALAAHYHRNENPLMTFVVLGVLCLLQAKRRWVARLAQFSLVFGSLVWIHTTWFIAQGRMEEGKDWKRAACILLCVAGFNLFAAVLYQTRRLKAYYTPTDIPQSTRENAVATTTLDT